MFTDDTTLFHSSRNLTQLTTIINTELTDVVNWLNANRLSPNRKWQDYVYIQCEYKSTKQKIKHLLREENKVKENKIS